MNTGFKDKNGDYIHVGDTLVRYSEYYRYILIHIPYDGYIETDDKFSWIRKVGKNLPPSNNLSIKEWVEKYAAMETKKYIKEECYRVIVEANEFSLGGGDCYKTGYFGGFRLNFPAWEYDHSSDLEIMKHE